jgi:excisionase family DNA binding protein
MLLTAKELAKKLDVHIDTIRRAYRKGEIPYERLCRLYFFDLKKVRDAMREKGLDLSGRPFRGGTPKGQAGAVRVGASRPRGHRRSRTAPELVTRGLS